MPRPKRNLYRKFFELDPVNKTNKCAITEKDKICGKVINNDHSTNLASHIKAIHKDTWAKLSEKVQNKVKAKHTSSTPKKNNNRTILSMLQVNISMTKETLLKSCVELCSVNGRPFSIVEDSGFRKIIEPVAQGLGGFTVNRKIIKDEVINKCKEITTTISKEMSGKLISLKIDGLTHLNRAFLGVNAQFIENGSIVLRTLAVAELFDRHTGEYLRDTIVKILHMYNITTEQIYTCTTDNGRNMLKCISLINEFEKDEEIEDDEEEEESYTNVEFDETLESFSLNSKCIGIRCAAHTLQLAINAILKEQDMKKIIEIARSVVKKLRTPNINILLKNQALSKPIIDCATRWSSTFDMLASLVDEKMKEFCGNLAQANNDFFLSQQMWHSINEVVETLRPANIATKILQKEQLTFGDAYDAWFGCKVDLQKIKNTFSYNLLEEMKKREEILFENEAFLGSLFLDPRWNVVLKSPFVERAIDHIVKVNAKIETIQNDDDCVSIDDDMSVNTSSSSDCVEAILKSMEKENSIIAPSNAKIRELLNGFRKEKRVPRHVNVLHWWRDNSKKKPELYKIANVVLAVPATQVSVERLFSGVKFIMNPQRNRLDQETLNALLVIRSNTDLF